MGKLCQACGKREAKIHFTEIREGKKTELHLCEQCAHEKNMIAAIPPFLSGIVGAPAARSETEPVPAACPACGLQYTDFKAKGRLGCATCYESFSPVLVPLLEKVHGKAKHVGRAPQRLERELKSRRAAEELEAQLRQAVADEDYERAAALRDRIREMKEGPGGGS